MPESALVQAAAAARTGPCPCCDRVRGDVDIYDSYRAMSFLVMTSWSTRTRMSCKGCHRRALSLDMFLTFLLGWWGLPWGIVATPIQLSRNVVSALRSFAGSQAPSKRLIDEMRVQSGVRMLAEQGAVQGLPEQGADSGAAA